VNQAAKEFCERLLREEQWLADSDQRSGECLVARVGDRWQVPAFQFQGGCPHPRLKELLRLLPPDGDGWAAMLWCFSPTKKLGGVRPADMLWLDTERVIDAARRDFVGDDADW
jgi:hypothetical protein